MSPSAAGVRVSAATVRNEMAVLEQEGYLRQPHTSAGRVPTDKGYRFFVDHLTQPGRLDRVQVAAGPRLLRRQPRRHRADAAGHQPAAGRAHRLRGRGHRPVARGGTVRSVQLVGLSGRVAMVVAVLSNGAVESHQLELDDDVDREHVAGRRRPTWPHHVVGHGRRRTGRRLPPSGDDAVDRLCGAAVAALCRAPSSTTRTPCSSVARSAWPRAFDAVEIVRKVLATLEQQYVVVTLLRDVLDRGLSVAIGAEHGVEPLVVVLGRRRALRGRGRARRHDRRARPDPHELPAGAGRRRGRQRAPRRPAERGLGSHGHG